MPYRLITLLRTLINIVIVIFLFNLLQTRTISVVSEETKKQLDQMIAQNKELEEILAKSRSDYNAKVRHKLPLFGKLEISMR